MPALRFSLLLLLCAHASLAQAAPQAGLVAEREDTASRSLRRALTAAGFAGFEVQTLSLDGLSEYLQEVSLAPNASREVAWAPQVLLGAEVLDRAEHDLHVWEPRPIAPVEQAARARNFEAPLQDGALRVPPAAWRQSDGPWRRVVANYRLFLDGVLARAYSEARRLVRTVDASHAASFRMQHAGDPTFLFQGWPGQSVPPLEEGASPAPSASSAYSDRFSVWDPAYQSPLAQRLEFARGFYRDFYRMARESDADGLFAWWLPGGFRVGENSDFGVLNPDGVTARRAP